MERRLNRKGKAKPKKNAPKRRLPRQATDKHVESMSAMKKPKFLKKGPALCLPSFKFKPAVFFTSCRVQGIVFNTHTGITGASLIAGAAAGYGFSLAFALDDCPDSTAYISLFDQFMIYRVVVQIEGFRMGLSAGGNGMNKCYVVCDYDNTAVLTSREQAESYQNCQILRGFIGSSTSGSILPVPLPDSLQIDTPLCVDVDAGGGTTIIPATWEDCATANITDHFGIKGWYDTSATTDAAWTVQAQYFLGFRNTQ
jgi:hypothetical protein